MTPIKYELIVYWSEADEAFIVEVPELAGCMADGQSYAEAVANAEIIIQEWIETAKMLGRIIPTPKGRLMYAWITANDCKKTDDIISSPQKHNLDN